VRNDDLDLAVARVLDLQGQDLNGLMSYSFKVGAKLKDKTIEKATAPVRSTVRPGGRPLAGRALGQVMCLWRRRAAQRAKR
jgi:hypothetical protein